MSENKSDSGKEVYAGVFRLPLAGAEFGSDDAGDEPMVRLHFGSATVPRAVYDKIQASLGRDNTFEVKL